MNSNHMVAGRFDVSTTPSNNNTAKTYSLYAVSSGGAGFGAVTASPAGPAYSSGATVTLTAAPASGYALTGWGVLSCGDATTCKGTPTSLASCGSASTCQVTLGTANLIVFADFSTSAIATTYALTTNTTGTGSGTISVSPAGPNYAPGTVVSVLATPAAGSAFSGWAGDCANRTSTTCAITMNSNHSITATFTGSTASAGSAQLSLSVSQGGTVSSSPAGINCGTACVSTFTKGQTVTLSATAQQGSVFAGWSGCSNAISTSCTLTLTGDTVVAAVFKASGGQIVRQGTVYSTAGSTAYSFLRFYNADTSSGTVAVTLADPQTGQTLAQWTSPAIAPGTAPQFAVSDIESGVLAGVTKPSYYAITMQSQFNGTFQHIVVAAGNGVLTDQSSCDSGIEAVSSRVANVRSSQLGSAGYPSSIVLYNTGPTASAAVLQIFNAGNANLMGSYQTASIPPNGQLIVPVATMETTLGITTTPDMIHYVVTEKGSFTGYLRHLVTNVAAGVTTDLSVVCSMAATQ
jgi:Divergent InlB B-repeat domain